jgi:uncharacterized protein (TIRG00374 family)
MKGWKFCFGLLLGLAALVYFSRDLEWATFAASWKRISWPRYFEGVFWFCFSFWLRCPRWQVLIKGLGKVPLAWVTKAFFVGMLVNRIFPARLGEIARCVALKRGQLISMWGLLATVAAEKAFDGLALLTLSLLALYWLPTGDLPSGLASTVEQHRTTLLISALGLPFVLAVAAWSIPWLQEGSRRFREQSWHPPFAKTLNSVFKGLSVMRKGHHSLAVTALTTLSWAALIRSEYCAFLSFGWDLPPTAAVVLCAAIGLAVSLPQAPSFVGVYQVAVQWTVAGLYEVDLQEAKAFAVALWFMQIVPVGIIGFVCLRLMGTSLKEATHVQENRSAQR